MTEAKFGKSSCATGKKCLDFTDPDGTIVNIKAYKQSEANKVLEKALSAGKVDHTLYAVVNARCSKDNKSSVAGTGDRQVAMFYMGENKEIYCSDNH